MDFIEGLPKSSVKDTIMVVMDRMTRYRHLIALAHPFNAQRVVEIFIENIYNYMVCLRVLCLIGTKFFQVIFGSLYEAYGH